MSDFRDPDWRLAACEGKPTRFWFPDVLDSGAYARLICSSCQIREGCLEYSLVHGIRHGIWGGLGDGDRRRIRRFRRWEDVA